MKFTMLRSTFGLILKWQEIIASWGHSLVAHRALRRQLGEAAAKMIRDHYTWDQNAARVVELARSLILARRDGG